MGYGLLRALPGETWLFCHRLHNAHCAIGRDTCHWGVRTTRLHRPPHTHSSVARSASSASRSAFVTTAKRPSCRMRRARLNIPSSVGSQVKFRKSGTASRREHFCRATSPSSARPPSATQFVRTLRALAVAAEGDGHALRQRPDTGKRRSCRRWSCKARRDAPRHQGRECACGSAAPADRPPRSSRLI